MDSTSDDIINILKGIDPKKDEVWWVRLPDEKTLVCVKILQITVKIVTIALGPVQPEYTYKKSDIEFVEKHRWENII